jgi:hypothetical protein
VFFSDAEASIVFHLKLYDKSAPQTHSLTLTGDFVGYGNYPTYMATTSLTITITPDSTAPSVAIVSHSDGSTLYSTTGTGSVNIQAQANDPETSICKLQVSCDGGSQAVAVYDPNIQTWQATFAGLQWGDPSNPVMHTFVATATNHADQSSTTSVHLYLVKITGTPEIVWLDPPGGTQIASPTNYDVNVRVNATPAKTGVTIKYVEINKDGQWLPQHANYDPVNHVYTLTVTLETGYPAQHTLQARAFDTQGLVFQTQQVQVSVYVPPVPPTISITSPSANQRFDTTGDSMPITVHVSATSD